MEGWVNKKKRTHSVVGQAYKRRYMVLDSNNLITYEAYEYGKKEPVGAKAGAVSLNGVEWELETFANTDRPYGLILSHQHLDSIFLSLETEDQMVAWKTALDDALLKRNPGVFEIGNQHSHYKILDLESLMQEEDLPFSVDILNHSYRHTERKIQEDYEREGDITKLDARISVHRAKRAYYATFEKHFGSNNPAKRKARTKYTATVQKKAISSGEEAGGSTLGFSLVESPLTARVMVAEVDADILVKSIGEEVEAIHPYDEISSIDGVVASAWPLCRVVQRLSAFFVGAGETVDIEFTRRENESLESLVASHLFSHSLKESLEQHACGLAERAYAAGGDKEKEGDKENAEMAGSTESLTKADKRGSMRRASMGLTALFSFSSKPDTDGGKEEAEGEREDLSPDNQSQEFASGGDSTTEGGAGAEDTNAQSTTQSVPSQSPRKSFSFFARAPSDGTVAELSSLKEKVAQHEQTEAFLRKDLSEKEDRIRLFEAQEIELHDQIASLMSELEGLESGKKKVAITPGLNIEEKVKRLRERYDIQ